MSAALAGGFFTIEPSGKPSISVSVCHLWGWMNCRCGGGGYHPTSFICCLLPWLSRTYLGWAWGVHSRQVWGHHFLCVHVWGGALTGWETVTGWGQASWSPVVQCGCLGPSLQGEDRASPGAGLLPHLHHLWCCRRAPMLHMVPFIICISHPVLFLLFSSGATRRAWETRANTNDPNS